MLFQFIDQLRVFVRESQEIAGAPREKKLISNTRHSTRQLTDDRIVFFAVGLLEVCQRLQVDDRKLLPPLRFPHLLETGRRNPGRPRDKVGSDPHFGMAKLEMGAPATAQPAQIKGSAEAIFGTSLVQHPQDETQRLLIFAQNPITVLAHHRQLVVDNRLT